jgi:repressor LexA
MSTELTKRQSQILKFIIECIRDNGSPPTIAEIGERFDISSTNGVNDHLVALEKKGYIERSSKARGITVTSKGATNLYQNEAGMAPVVGRIAAGATNLAEQHIDDYVAVPMKLADRGGFCLKVRGESMIEDGILHGDLVVVDPTLRPRTGDVVVALVDGEATVKHFHPKGNAIELRPANSTMKPIIVAAEDVAIQGVVVSVQRQLK